MCVWQFFLWTLQELGKKEAIVYSLSYATVMYACFKKCNRDLSNNINIRGKERSITTEYARCS
jgi:hypothetical protein